MIQHARSTGSILALVLVLAAGTTPRVPGSEAPESMERDCRREIEGLHRFFQEWFNAAVPNDDATFERLAAVLAPEFTLIGPEGETADRAEVLAALKKAYGRWSESRGRIHIEGIRMHHIEAGAALLTYDEWHDVGATRKGRRSSVLLGPANGTPNGLEWLHLHEVWIPEDHPSAP